MVSTRNHPTPLPPPSTSTTTSPSKPLTATQNGSAHSHRRSQKSWTHTPTPFTIIWLLFSLPLVIWDTGYVLLRPYTFPGGALHDPLYRPYALYGVVDKVYGQEAYYDHYGFTAAQAALNFIETAGYLTYLWVVWQYGGGSGKGGFEGGLGKVTRALGFDGAVGGGWGGFACLVGFALNVMTISKTLLYGLNEYYSNFKHTSHNDPLTIFMCYIIPNGAWIVFPTYIAYFLAVDILHGLSMASGDSSSPPARAAIMAKEE